MLSDIQQQNLVNRLSDHTPMLAFGADAYYSAMCALASPYVLMRPSVYKDGDKWCALYGTDIQSGVVGFGDTPAKACEAFDREWHGHPRK